MLRISLLGVLRLEVDGVEVAPPSSRRARLLLAMLALERRPHSRETLAARLWPRVVDESARASLRTALTQLRAALGPDASRFLVATRERVALASPDKVWTDVGELERLLGKGEAQAALRLSGEELLIGLEDDWVYERRDEQRQRLCEVLGLAAGEAEAGGNLQTALLLTRHQAALDPLAEGAQREVIRLLACAGDRAAALAAYDKLSQRLREQVRTVPSAATRELVAAVRAGAVPAGGGGDKSRPGQDGADVVPVSPASEAAVGRTVAWPALPRSLQSSSTLPFVGREAELVRLRECWRQVCDGARAAVVVDGEPGIGKTRLAAELAREVHRQGALVLYGRCDEGLAVPYQPFVEALRPYAGTFGLDRLGAELGHLAPELGRLLPELAGLGDPTRGDPESERFALFEAVAALIEAATLEQRALLVLDDLHWAATPTLLLLRHLIRSERPLGALVLCTYRDTELDLGQPLAQLLADLHRDASAERVSIGGLDEPAIAALLEAAVGHALDERASKLVQVLGVQTAGNPFFIRELLAHVGESDERSTPGVTAGQLEAPEGLRQVIGQRVARLSAPAGRALNVAAVAGPTFPLVLVERVLGEDSGVLEGLEEAVAAGLLTASEHGDYVFAHALVRQTIYQQLGAMRRMRLHRQLGETLEALGDQEAHVEALAYHFAQAAADGQGVKAAAYALAAGRNATDRLGYEDAAAHYERGLQALTLTGQPSEERRCELLLALGEALWGAGELDKAKQIYRQAAELADKLGDVTALAHAALGFGGPHRPEVAAAVALPVADLLQRALTALGKDDSALRAQLMARLAAALAYTGSEYRNPLLARQALEMARRVADKATLADVLASTHWATRGPDTLHERLAMTRELVLVADELGDNRLRALTHWWLLEHLLEQGDIEAVQRELDALQRLADARMERHINWLLAVFRANHAHLQGRLERCETLAHDALAQRFEGHDETAAQTFTLQMLVVRREQGRVVEMLDTIEGFVAQNRHPVAWRCVLASIYAQLEHTAQARQEFEALARADFQDVARDALWLWNLSALCEVVVFLGDAPRAQLLYKLLLPYADRYVVIISTLCQGSVSRPLGLLAATLSRYEDAAQHFEYALTTNAQIRSPLWTAHTQHDYAHMLLQRNQTGDRELALELLGDALATAEELGLKALADKTRPLKLTADTAAPPLGRTWPRSAAPE